MKVNDDHAEQVGYAVLAEARQDPTFASKLRRILERRIDERSTREALGIDRDAGDHTETGR